MAAIKTRQFASRRQELMNLLEDDAIAIVAGAGVRKRNGDVEYRFRQDSNFHYLTGFDEPDAVLALVPGRAHGETILFCSEQDAESVRWFGGVMGPEQAAATLGVDDAFPLEDMDDILPGLIEGRAQLYYALGNDSDFDDRVIDWIDAANARLQAEGAAAVELRQLEPLVHEQRLVKSAPELHVIRRAAEISVAAHRDVMALIEPGMHEHRVQAELEYRFACAGARAPAYPTIVASGDNSWVLHYTRNTGQLTAGALVVIDAGCEFDCYAADVTRTLPVSGEFTAAQRALYDIVLAAQDAAIAAVKPGNHWNQPHEAAVAVIVHGLVDLGILAGPVAAAMESGAYLPYYMHRTGHWLGLDVHDAGEYQVGGQWRVLEPGMVMTVEPGLYFPPDAEVPADYQGIGLRIEDMVLVTRDGVEVLTEGLPRTAVEIEAVMAPGGPVRLMQGGA